MLFRYPGGKGKIAKAIVEIIGGFYSGGDRAHFEFREPFFGAGGIGFEVLKNVDLRRAWFNDRDPAICCVWERLLRDSQGFQADLCGFVPNVDAFHAFKSELEAITCFADVVDPAPVALKKVACHQMSYSGLGTMAGGPMGGKSQTGKYGVGCRYSVQKRIKDIDKAAELLDRVELHPDVCSNLDFEQVLRFPGDALFYLDPPYFKEGPGLYQFSFGEEDHARLASLLREESRPWLLSYDTHPAIEELYGGWAEVGEVAMTCTINGANQKTEYLIANEPLAGSVRDVCSRRAGDGATAVSCPGSRASVYFSDDVPN